MKLHYIYFAAAAILIFSSCSTSLRVQVSTAHPDSLKLIAEKIDSFEKLAFQYKKVLQPLAVVKLITQKDAISTQFFKKLDEVFTPPGAPARTPEQERANNLRKDRLKQSFQENYTEHVDGILTDFNNANKAMVKKQYVEAVDIYLAMPQKMQTLLSNLSAENILTTEQKDSLIPELSSRLTAVNAVFYGGRANLLGDEMVAYITSNEHKKMWKSTYNRTVNNTLFGNADIAVVLNEVPDSYNNNYSIKGVRVDAAKLIQATFDVMTQVVNVAASMYGITMSDGGDKNSFYPTEFEELKTLPTKTAELQNRKELFKEVQKQTLLKILGEDLDHKGTAGIRKSAAAIQSYWDSSKATLTPEITPTTSSTDH